MKLDTTSIETAEFDLTTICNARCSLCYRNYRSFSDKYKVPFHRSTDEITTQMDSFPNLKNVYLIGQLSEPTTHPDFIQIVEFSKNKGLHVKICTNGDLHNDDFWKNLGSILDNDDEVWFTLCGSTQEIHEHYRVNTNLTNILHHADVLRSVRRVDCAKCIRFIYNSSDLDSEEFRKIVRDFSKVEFTNTNYPSKKDEFTEEFEYLDFLPTKNVFKDYQKMEMMTKFYKNLNRNDVYCQSLNDKSVQIDAYGDIFPCYVYMEDHNIKKWDGSYDEILTGKFDCCRFCNSRIVEYCEKHDRNSII